MTAEPELETAQGAAKVLPLQAPPQSPRVPLRARIFAEIRSRPFGYTVLAIFMLAGPLLAPLLFPQAPPAAAAAGGLAFGLYAALCAVPQKFL